MASAQFDSVGDLSEEASASQIVSIAAVLGRQVQVRLTRVAQGYAAAGEEVPGDGNDLFSTV